MERYINFTACFQAIASLTGKAVVVSPEGEQRKILALLGKGLDRQPEADDSEVKAGSFFRFKKAEILLLCFVYCHSVRKNQNSGASHP